MIDKKTILIIALFVIIAIMSIFLSYNIGFNTAVVETARFAGMTELLNAIVIEIQSSGSAVIGDLNVICTALA